MGGGGGQGGHGPPNISKMNARPKIHPTHPILAQLVVAIPGLLINDGIMVSYVDKSLPMH
jgi:hypothetical protein